MVEWETYQSLNACHARGPAEACIETLLGCFPIPSNRWVVPVTQSAPGPYMLHDGSDGLLVTSHIEECLEGEDHEHDSQLVRG